MARDKSAGASTTSVARTLAQRIVAGELSEGAVLPRETELAAEFEVSRASIRESLSLLKAKGLIGSRPKAGTRVLPRDGWNMMDGDLLDWTWRQRPAAEFAHRISEVRRIIEPEASALCAQNGSDSDIAAIERAFREMDAAGGDVDAFADPDLRFHRGILIGTGNEFLVAFGAIVEAALRMSFELSTRSSGAPRKSMPLHRDVLDQIWARNPEGARQAMHRLLDLTDANIRAAINRRSERED